MTTDINTAPNATTHLTVFELLLLVSELFCIEILRVHKTQPFYMTSFIQRTSTNKTWDDVECVNVYDHGAILALALGLL